MKEGETDRERVEEGSDTLKLTMKDASTEDERRETILNSTGDRRIKSVNNLSAQVGLARGREKEREKEREPSEGERREREKERVRGERK